LKHRNGFSLLEALVAISMLSLLMAGAVSALRITLKSSERIQTGIAAQRRISRAETDLREQIASLMPVSALCNSVDGGPRASVPFFEGEPDEMRFVSGYSLEDKFRSSPQVVEFKVLSGEKPGELRLIVNEQAWPGSSFVAPCLAATDASGLPSLRFAPVQSFPSSFVLADKLSHCRFSYLHRDWKQQSQPGEGFPDAVRVEINGLANIVVPIAAKGEL
jgi:prepilin-type N-terminal cleavage/methylation domain-containing protein